MEFLLTVHHPGWLTTAAVPLMVSHRRLRTYRTLPQAAAPWVLDSGGFTELSLYGRWTITPAEYIAAARRYQAEVGRLRWVAPQDWMCEPHILAKTGLTVADHQQRTIRSALELKAAGLPVVPVLQGWRVSDYADHAAAYDRAGINLHAEPVVGVGSVCKLQATGKAAAIINLMHSHGLTNLHGFGIKLQGLSRYGHQLASSDSLAWSYDARRSPPLPGHSHMNCANCLTYALAWRERVLQRISSHAASPHQTMLGLPA